MFFGLDVKNNRASAKFFRLAQDLKLGQAVLDISEGMPDRPVSLVVEYQKKPFVIAVLDPKNCLQVPLDLCFERGARVRFYLRGDNATVHITGYDIINENDLFNESESDSSQDLHSDNDSELEEEDEEEEVENGEGEQPARKKLKKSPKALRQNNSLRNGKPTKLARDDDDDDDDDDESDDEDFMYSDISMSESDEDTESDPSENGIEDDTEDDDDDDMDEDEEEEDESEDDE